MIIKGSGEEDLQYSEQITDMNKMLTSINESLIYIDDDITLEQRQIIDSMVTNELSLMDTTVPHPLSHSASHDSHLVRDIYAKEEEEWNKYNDDDNSDDGFSIGGIDMNKYTDLTTSNDELNYPNMYSSIAHSNLRRRLLVLQNQDSRFGNHQLRNKWLIYNEELEQYVTQMEIELNKKRSMVDEVNKRRKRRQLQDFKPVEDYLSNRWIELIQSCVEVGVECAELELSLDNNDDDDEMQN